MWNCVQFYIGTRQSIGARPINRWFFLDFPRNTFHCFCSCVCVVRIVFSTAAAVFFCVSTWTAANWKHSNCIFTRFESFFSHLATPIKWFFQIEEKLMERDRCSGRGKNSHVQEQKDVYNWKLSGEIEGSEIYKAQHFPSLFAQAVQPFNGDAFADRSRPAVTLSRSLWRSLKIFQLIRFAIPHFIMFALMFAIDDGGGSAIDFYDYRYLVPNISSQLPQTKTRPTIFNNKRKCNWQ